MNRPSIEPSAGQGFGKRETDKLLTLHSALCILHFSLLCQSLKDKRLRGGDPSFNSASSNKIPAARDDKLKLSSRKKKFFPKTKIPLRDLLYRTACKSRLWQRREKCRMQSAECRVKRLSVSPLPKSKFAEGSEEEIPRLTLRLRDGSLPLGMTVLNSSFLI